jgi:hypothetical protein
MSFPKIKSYNHDQIHSISPLPEQPKGDHKPYNVSMPTQTTMIDSSILNHSEYKKYIQASPKMPDQSILSSHDG